MGKPGVTRHTFSFLKEYGSGKGVFQHSLCWEAVGICQGSRCLPASPIQLHEGFGAGHLWDQHLPLGIFVREVPNPTKPVWGWFPIKGEALEWSWEPWAARALCSAWQLPYPWECSRLEQPGPGEGSLPVEGCGTLKNSYLLGKSCVSLS